MKRKVLVIMFLFLFGGLLNAQEIARIMSYNILNYGSSSSFSRNGDLKIVISHADPDVVVVQEITSQAGVDMFLTQILNPKFKAGTFLNGADTDNAIFYKDSLFTFAGNVRIITALRDINEFTLIHKITSDTLKIYSLHLKASQGSDNEAKRLAEVQRLRLVTDALPISSNFLILGDFNFYNSSEAAFQALLNQTNTGYVKDPINQIGNWHNNSSYRAVHTQSPRTTQFGGGSHGGLDDRFDFILASETVMTSGGIEYIDGSYTAVGNDGNHFNDAINDGSNNVVSALVANALHDGSDHLPIYADFSFEIITSVEDENLQPNKISLFQNYPNPFNPTTEIKIYLPATQEVKLEVFNMLGQNVATLYNGVKTQGYSTFKFNANNLSSGMYIYRLSTETNILSKKLMLLK